MLYSLIISLSVMMLLFGLGYVAAHTVIPQETVGEEVTGYRLQEKRNIMPPPRRQMS